MALRKIHWSSIDHKNLPFNLNIHLTQS
jgi:hypothetical protein